MKQKLGSKNKIGIYDYDYQLKQVFSLIKKEFSEKNVQLTEKYDLAMVNASLSKATRHKNLKMILSLTRLLNKDWEDVTKDDVDRLVWKIMNQYGDDNGQETNTSHDHKKTLKISFRWIKFGSREKNEVGDPPETKQVKLRKVKDKIVREHLLTEEDKTKLLHVCGENARDRVFIDCHFEAGTRPGEELKEKYNQMDISDESDSDEGKVPEDLKRDEIKFKPSSELRKKTPHQKGITKLSSMYKIDPSKPLTLAILCQKKWKLSGQQDFAVVVTMEHEKEIDLYNNLQTLNVVRSTITPRVRV